MPGQADSVIHSIRVWLYTLVGITVVLAVLLTAVALFSWFRVHKAEQSFCALRSDLQHRIVQGEEFVATHPKGFAGLPVAAINAQIDNQRRTVHALKGLSC